MPRASDVLRDGEIVRVAARLTQGRVIDTVSTEISADAPATLVGYSIGRWVGDMLVIETV